MGRPHDERQGRLFPGARAGRFPQYAPQGAGENNIDHIHTIYREPANDYAARAARR